MSGNQDLNVGVKNVLVEKKAMRVLHGNVKFSKSAEEVTNGIK